MIDSMQRQDITLWRKSGMDVYGQPAYALPVPIAGRWTESYAEYVNTQGQKLISTATIDLDPEYSPVTPGDVVRLGLVYDLTDAERITPQSGAGAWVVKHVDPAVNLMDGTGWLAVYL